jgi:hypothetical protein
VSFGECASEYMWCSLPFFNRQRARRKTPGRVSAAHWDALASNTVLVLPCDAPRPAVTLGPPWAATRVIRCGVWTVDEQNYQGEFAPVLREHTNELVSLNNEVQYLVRMKDC